MKYKICLLGMGVWLMAGLPQLALAANSRFTATGYSYNYTSQYSAQQRALQECRKKRGGDCKVYVTHSGCAALAVGQRRTSRKMLQGGYVNDGVGYNNEIRARNTALKACRSKGTNGCRVLTPVCNRSR